MQHLRENNLSHPRPRSSSAFASMPFPTSTLLDSRSSRTTTWASGGTTRGWSFRTSTTWPSTTTWGPRTKHFCGARASKFRTPSESPSRLEVWWTTRPRWGWSRKSWRQCQRTFRSAGKVSISRLFRVVQLNLTMDIEVQYSIWCLRDVIIKIERDLSNSIWNTSISGVKFSRTTLY